MKRGRNQRRRQGGGNPNRALDSNGPDVRIRGTANQIYDKYITLARDASSSGDRIKAESYLQHAEHYFRVIRATQPPQQQQSGTETEGDQPNVEGDDDNNNNNKSQRDDRGDNRRRNNRQNDRAAQDRQSENADEAPKEEAAATKDKPLPAVENAQAAGDAVEEKPKRAKRPRRTTKRAASEKESDPEDDDTPTVAAE